MRSSEYLMVREMGLEGTLALSLVGEDLVTLPGDILESLLSTSLLRPSFLELFFTQLITIRWPSCTKHCIVRVNSSA